MEEKYNSEPDYFPEILASAAYKANDSSDVS
jgi:hypothetical protein